MEKESGFAELIRQQQESELSIKDSVTIKASHNNDKSDIDLLVEISDTDPIERGEKLISL